MTLLIAFEALRKRRKHGDYKEQAPTNGIRGREEEVRDHAIKRTKNSLMYDTPLVTFKVLHARPIVGPERRCALVDRCHVTTISILNSAGAAVRAVHLHCTVNCDPQVPKRGRTGANTDLPALPFAAGAPLECRGGHPTFSADEKCRRAAVAAHRCARCAAGCRSLPVMTGASQAAFRDPANKKMA